GFRIVAIEGDWPDAARLHRWVRGEPPGNGWQPFARFPTWMWRNRETEAFASWLRAFNASRAPVDRAGCYGLDLYSMYRSAQSVIETWSGSILGRPGWRASATDASPRGNATPLPTAGPRSGWAIACA